MLGIKGVYRIRTEDDDPTQCGLAETSMESALDLVIKRKRSKRIRKDVERRVEDEIQHSRVTYSWRVG